MLPVYRITVFVPEAAVDALVAGILAVDDLAQSGYREVMWISRGVCEQFRPDAGAVPAFGKAGELAQVASVRLELAIPRDAARLAHLIAAGIRPHHPWRSPAIFVDESFCPLPELPA